MVECQKCGKQYVRQTARKIVTGMREQINANPSISLCPKSCMYVTESMMNVDSH